MANERRNTHLFRLLGAGLVLTVSGWALYWRPRPKPPEAGSAAVSLAADHEAYLKEHVDAMLQAGRWQDAEPLEAELLQTQPGNPALLRQSAELQAKLGHDPQALALWERFRKVAPGSAAFCPAQGDACLRLGRLRDAIETFRQAVALEPRNPAFTLALARAYEQDHQYEQAAESYAQACTLDPLLEPARLGLARNQHRLGANSLALDNLARVLRDAPENVEAILLRGLLLQKEGRYLQARQTLEKGLVVAPEDKNIMLALARVAEASGQFKVAVAWLERVLAQLQGAPEAQVASAQATKGAHAKDAPVPAAEAPASRALVGTPEAPASRALVGTSEAPASRALVGTSKAPAFRAHLGTSEPLASARHPRHRQPRAVEAPAPATGASPSLGPTLTDLRSSDLPRILTLGARHLRAMPSGHWTLRLEVAFRTWTLRESAAAFPAGTPDLFLLPITASSGAKGYQLLLGDFSSKGAAQEAIRTMPARFLAPGQRPIPCQVLGLRTGEAP